MEKFEYTPLEQLQIRLLVLAPGSETEQLVCGLSVVDLDACPSYFALSYVWGCENRPNNITCRHAGIPKGAPQNGPRIFTSSIPTYLKITDNLKDAMQTIRSTSKYQYFWIDSLCINQEDVHERSQQVQLMDQIYKNAEEVLIYVGPEDSKTSSTFKFFHSVSKKGDLGNDVRVWFPGVYGGLHLVSESELLKSYKVHDPWIGWTEFLIRPWFSRLWTWQEVIVSRQATIICGKHQMPWDVLVEACRVVEISGIDLSDPRRSRAISILHMEETRRALISYSTLDPNYAPPEEIIFICNQVAFSTLLNGTRQTMTTDPRDKIFAILNICRVHGPETKTYLVPDYTLPVREVFLRAMAAWFHESTKDSRLDFLHYVQGSFNSTSGFNLPSWVPDWTHRYSANPLRLLSSFKSRASGRSSYAVTFPPMSAISDVSADVLLVVRGIRLMCIKELQRATELERRHAAMLPRYQAHYPTSHETYLEAYSQIWNLNYPHHSTKPSRPQPRAYWLHEPHFELGQQLLATPDEDQPTRHTQEELDALLPPVIRAGLVEGLALGRAFFVSNDGFIGLVPQDAETGDEIVLLFGLTTPFVVRRQASGHFTLVGECLVHGIMDGEAMEGLPEERVEDFSFQ
ncbi:HET-domain-containing protein [Stipitochalara longipes BDJ]|nr:HET-domain-containing protein [Stipitochalara longipes BDJ]